ncbi:aspartate/glutamate racemase family protein [Inquilinus limosus]|uniref:aspartate/glutamate racemase family protein n=1 Tax=Inquilinus limosus TaxID=171674 RepID=UPI003F5CC722
MNYRRIGVLGGMGPLATIDFMQKIVRLTPASIDQEHIPIVVYSVPQIPDRTAALNGGGPDPYPTLLDGIQTLERSGAELIVIACNTAHAWYDRLSSHTRVPLLHIAEAVRRQVDREEHCETLGLMAAPATAGLGFYQSYLKRPLLQPDTNGQDAVWRAISAVKALDIEEGQKHAEQALDSLFVRGADKVLLACTELPIALAKSASFVRCIDATACLAAACIEFSLNIQMRSITATIDSVKIRNSAPN